MDITNGIVLAGDALTIRVDRAKAGIEGMDPDEVTFGRGASCLAAPSRHKIEQPPKSIGIRAWIPEKYRRTADDVGSLRLRAPDGHFFPLRRVAEIGTDTGQPQIDRDDLKRLATVTARISGRDLGSTVKDVEAELNKPGAIPAGVTYTLGRHLRRTAARPLPG